MARRRRELIPGGLAPGGHCPRDVDRRELAMGIKVELEHTGRRCKPRRPCKQSKLARRRAREIACDHLTEDRRYYSKLRKIHRG